MDDWKNTVFCVKKYWKNPNIVTYFYWKNRFLPIITAVSNPVFPLTESRSKNLLIVYYNDVGMLPNILYRNNIDAVVGVCRFR